MGTAFSPNIGISTQLFHVRDEKAISVNGGTFTQNTWQTRDLNTVVLNEVPGASLASNQITLPAGTYYVDALAPAFGVERHVIRIQDITNALTLVSGDLGYSAAGSSIDANHSFVSGKFVLTATVTVELQHICNSTRASNGLGLSSVNATGVFGEVKLHREIPAVNDGNGELVKGPLLHVQHQEANNVSGGTATASIWATRVLNTLKHNGIIGTSLASNQFTLPPGSYDIEAWGMGYACNGHQIKLQNITGSVTIKEGSTEISGTGGATSTHARLSHRFTIAVSTTFEIQHLVETTRATNGYGRALSTTGAVEVYANVQVWKLVKAGSVDASVGAGITLGTPVAATSGTSIDFTDIPAGTKQITINFKSVSTNGVSPYLIQLGDAGGVETSGYLGSTTTISGASVIATTNDTAGMRIFSALAATTFVNGSVVLTLENITVNNWVGSLGISNSASTAITMGHYSKTLSSALDRVRITTTGGTDVFDAGEINITYQ